MFKKIFLLLLLILTGCSIYVFVNLNAILVSLTNKNLQHLLNFKGDKSLYEFKVDTIYFDLWNGDINIENVIMQAKQQQLDSLIKHNYNSSVVLKAKLEKFQLKNLNLYELILHQNILIDSIIIKRPRLYITHYKEHFQKGRTQKKGISRDLVSEHFKFGSIDFLSIENAKVKWMDSKDTSSQFYCDSVYINIYNILTDQELLKASGPVKVSNITFSGKHFHFNMIEDVLIASHDIHLSLKENDITLNNIIIKHTLSKTAFTRKQRVAKEWFDMKLKRLEIKNNAETNYWTTNNDLHINHIIIEKPEANIYKDKRKGDPLFHEKPLPVSALRHLKLKFLVDTLTVKNGHVKYEEIEEKGTKAGKINFTPLNIEAYNISNIPSHIQKHRYLTVHVNGKFLGTAPLSVTLKLDQTSKHDHFEAIGHIKNLNATDLNKITSNMVFVDFDKGYIPSATFKFKANNDSAWGILDAHYENLHFELIDTATYNKTHELKHKKLLSFFANTLIKSNNVPDTKSYRQGIVDTKRLKNKSIINFLWQAIKSGLVSTALPHSIANKINHKRERKAIKAEKKALKKKQKEERKQLRLEKRQAKHRSKN
jgi:hypothetical protein